MANLKATARSYRGGCVFEPLPVFREELALADQANPGIAADVVALVARVEGSGVHESRTIKYPMVTHPAVGRFRLPNYWRLYFAEPSAHRDLVLGLMLAAKPPESDPHWRAVQDAHIEESGVRFDGWVADHL